VKIVRINLILLGLVIGAAIGLLLGWVVYPRQLRIATPKDLHSEYRDKYVVMVAAAYSRDGDLERARIRLDKLGADNVLDTTTSQAQRWAAAGRSDFDVSVLAELALALSSGDLETESASADIPISTMLPKVTSTVTPYPTVVVVSPVPTLALLDEYMLLDKTVICDEQMDKPIIKVYVIDAVGNPVPGVQLRIDWTTGSDMFSTGLHPDIGIGYGDFTIDPKQVYTLQVGNSTNPIYGLTSEPCRQGDSDEFAGSISVTWQREG
tara:strand:- start:12852 stop:13646 length:795 start_codon:yes stop_codon:yes gene_type:complete